MKKDSEIEEHYNYFKYKSSFILERHIDDFN
jgi:hypothetical protein